VISPYLLARVQAMFASLIFTNFKYCFTIIQLT
jgi:hypothetical protein